MLDLFFRARVCSFAVVTFFGGLTAEAQINAWTNGSANWEDLHWTLGIPPRAGQSIYITNAGFKAVAVSLTNSAASLTVSSINLWGVNNSSNVLLLNFSGLQNPLTTSVLNISTNGTVTPLHATLNVTGALTIDGSVNQGVSAQVNAGSITVGTINTVSSTDGQMGFYNLTNGSVQISGNLVVGGRGAFNHLGGTQTNLGTALLGFDPQRTAFGIASYTLNSGILSTPSLNLDFGGFTQTGGTNLVSGSVTVSSGSHFSTYNLSGGLLLASNTTVAFTPGLFIQSGGVHTINNLLRISHPDNGSGYIQSGGQLTAPNITADTGAAFHHNGGVVSNTVLLTLAGQNSEWDENTAGQQMGRLLLGSFTSILSLPAIGCILRFADSSSTTWSNQAMLNIEHWNGSRTGGGQHRIFFGTNAGGLTLHQLSQIQFQNPGGFTGFFPAAILATGEIVPVSVIQTVRLGNALVIDFPNGTILQTATNVLGPYTDTPATSPSTNLFTDPQRFWRLKN